MLAEYGEVQVRDSLASSPTRCWKRRRVKLAALSQIYMSTVNYIHNAVHRTINNDTQSLMLNLNRTDNLSDDSVMPSSSCQLL
jgi:hypothetical protein